jgi:hypothetical protein
MTSWRLWLLAIAATVALGLFAWLMADTRSEILMFTAIFCVCLAVPCVTISYGNAWRRRPEVKPADFRRFAMMLALIALGLLIAMAFS